MSASVAFKIVLKMLEECAAGFEWRVATHSRIVTYNRKSYRALPKHDNIELGHIRKMVRFLGIDHECAQKHIQI